jgi:hypothetical protein
MIRGFLLSAASLALVACASAPRPDSIAAVASAHDWGNAQGADLNAAYQADMTRLLKGLDPAAAATALKDAQYECDVGDATVCKRSFATRACQMDWSVAYPTNSLRIPAVSASFRRDCIGRTGDWPVAKDSAIDDQVAAPPRPAY